MVTIVELVSSVWAQQELQITSWLGLEVRADWERDAGSGEKVKWDTPLSLTAHSLVRFELIEPKSWRNSGSIWVIWARQSGNPECSEDILDDVTGDSVEAQEN